ncbi:hypothetical protein AA0113_g12614 [Alternaria arborescens]|uniref:Chromo domain-containing protein n=1 Tax=Alternaria arborescens TaxID=156630 RepID=A0A4Q4PWM0_9PLEO|nr:hypothetical protein AA0113_g12614 [Alternaria arborescens]
MLGREPRGGRGFRRGKGLGRDKTQIWEWKPYTPGAEVYEQLWRVRKEPAIVTARLPDDCPIPNARTRIIYRRQTKDAIKRERYTVEITHISQPEDRHDRIDRTEVEDVDFTRIMQYVSPAELERYETEQFRLEAEAEAVAIRTEAEDLARRQLHKNTKLPNTNRGSRMLSGLELPVSLPTRARGRPRRSRGRSRGRTGDLKFDSRQLEDETREELVDSEPITTRCLTDYIRQPIQTSPGVARSAFVVNSALPVSSIPTRLSTSLPQQGHTGLSVLDNDVGLAPASRDAKPLSNTSNDMLLHRPLPFDQSSTTASDSDDTIPAQPPPHHESNADVDNDTLHMHAVPSDNHSSEYSKKDEEDAEGAEEYVVEAIVNHFQEDGKKYYLVKWDVYEDSHDWLPEEDLEGAADLVAEYNDRLGGKNKKVKLR